MDLLTVSVSMDNLRGLNYVATLVEIDTYNDIQRRYVDLNLQASFLDQQLQKLVQDCSERDDDEVLFLKKAVEQLKKDQETMKQSLRESLVCSFQSKSSMDIHSLDDGFMLEQEVYELLTTSKLDELKFFMARIEGFTQFVDGMNMKARDLRMELDGMPENLKNLATWNFGQSGNRKTQIPQQQGFNHSSHMGRMMVVMYGFPPDVALDIQKSLPSRKLVSQAIKIKNCSTFRDSKKKEEFDPMSFLDDEVVCKNCEQEDEETLHWKNFSIAKQNFEDMVIYLLHEDNHKQNVDKNRLEDEILKATRDFVFHTEIVLCDLLHIFYDLMPGYKPAVTNFQKFNSVIKEIKERQNGMVPIIFYKVLAMPLPSIACPGVGSDKEALYKEIEFHQVINALSRVFLMLGLVLKKITSHAQRKALIACRAILSQADKLVREIALKIYGVKSRYTMKIEDDEFKAPLLDSACMELRDCRR